MVGMVGGVMRVPVDGSAWERPGEDTVLTHVEPVLKYCFRPWKRQAKCVQQLVSQWLYFAHSLLTRAFAAGAVDKLAIAQPFVAPSAALFATRDAGHA
jgi:hypothetical protein